MIVQNIKYPEVQARLEGLGFQKRTERRYTREVTEFCYYGDNGVKTRGNEAPTLVIDAETGRIYMWFTSTYFMRAIPDVLYKMICWNMIITEDTQN